MRNIKKQRFFSKKNMIVLQGLTLFCLGSLVAFSYLKDIEVNNKKNNLKDDCNNIKMNYYKNKVVILWNLSQEEREDYFKTNGLSEFEADVYYDFTMAQNFLFEECDKTGIKVISDDNNCCGFIFDNGDTIILKKIDFKTVDNLFKIILFDGIKQPKVLSPTLIDDFYYEYW